MVWPEMPIPCPSLVCDFVTYDSSLFDTTKVKQTVETKPFTQCLQILLPRRTTSLAGRSSKSRGENFEQLFEKHCPMLNSLLNGNVDESLFQDSFDYCHVTNVPVHLFFHKLFVESYIKKGQVYVVSLNTKIEFDNCLCILPSGVLTLSVTEKTYHRLGLEGKPSLLNRKKNVCNKYIIEIDLKSELVSKVESKYYERTFQCLRNSGLKFDVVTKWEPDDDVSRNVSPSKSIKQYIHFMVTNPGDGGAHLLNGIQDAKEIVARTCSPSTRTHTVPLPMIPSNFLEGCHIPVREQANKDTVEDNGANDEDSLMYAEELIEWCGAQMCSIRGNAPASEPDVSSFGFDPAKSTPLASVRCVAINGFFTPNNVSALIKEYENFMLDRRMTRKRRVTEDKAAPSAPTMESDKSYLNEASPPSYPFCVIIANGWPDSIVSWSGKNNEHGKQLSGENDYGILMSFHDRKCLLWRLADGYDFSIEKL